MRQPLLWIAAMAAVGTAILLRDGKDGENGQVERTIGPDLFHFVRALPADTGGNVANETGLQDTTAEPAAVVAAKAFQTEEAVRRMRAHGSSDDEVYRARAAALGAETAATLARLDREEAHWQQRVAAYFLQRQASAADPMMLQALKDRLFSVEEQERLAAYEPALMPLTGMPQW